MSFQKKVAGFVLTFLVWNILGLGLIYSRAHDASYYGRSYSWWGPMAYSAALGLVFGVCFLLIAFLARDD